MATTTKTPEEIRVLADTFRQRAKARWHTKLTPETTLLVADALDSYHPKSPPEPYHDPGSRFRVDMFSDGSTVYRLDDAGEIFEIVAWARNTLIARAAFDALLGQYPKDEFMQKRRS